MKHNRSEQNPLPGSFMLPPIAESLLAWYDSSRRILPWREDPTPYHVWVSEIMLQQTRVEAVIPYYERFLAELPDVSALAFCPEDRLLKLWEGLGYYSRVRNLQKAARQVMEQYGGKLPSDPKLLEKLAGIGPYTAAAIASIAYQVPAPSVDGNLLRVFARLTGYGENILAPAAKKLAEQAFAAVLPADRPGDMNQALMDLGATICLPNGAPLCSRCPLAELCSANRGGLQAMLPVAEKKAPRRMEKRTVLLVRTAGRRPENTESSVLTNDSAPAEDCILLRRRPAKGLLAGLWEFPNIEGHLTDAEVSGWCAMQGLSAASIRPLPSARHVFTHLEWDMTGFEVRVTQNTPSAGGSSLKKFPFAQEAACAGLSSGREKTDGIFVPVRLIFSDYALPSAFAAYAALLK